MKRISEAINAADSSCLTNTNLILSYRFRNAPIKPLIPLPGIPKMTLTPQSITVSVTISEVSISYKTSRLK